VLSDGVGNRVAAYREARGMSRRELAIRVAELVGDPAFLTAPVLGNIETGRPGDDGVRRRMVSVDELMVLASALAVPPLVLLCPVGEGHDVEALPGQRFDAWDVAKWFVGKRPSFEEGTPIPTETYEAWSAAARNLHEFADHDERVHNLEHSVGLMLRIQAAAKETTGQERVELQLRQHDTSTLVEEISRNLRKLRSGMRERGIEPPPLTRGLEILFDDTVRRVGLPLPLPDEDDESGKADD
jgi:transcriptional regulator with XRE-family HTH domain